MALFGKLGGLMRQNAAQSVLVKSGLGVAAAAVPSLLVLQRGMSSSKLFIGGILPNLSGAWWIVFHCAFRFWT
jgi:hypothetical protein